jgi:hypothetical protein
VGCEFARHRRAKAPQTLFFAYRRISRRDGTAPSLNPDPSNPTLENNGGDVRDETDFWSVYARVLDNWLGAASTAILGGDFRARAPPIVYVSTKDTRESEAHEEKYITTARKCVLLANTCGAVVSPKDYWFDPAWMRSLVAAQPRWDLRTLRGLRAYG